MAFPTDWPFRKSITIDSDDVASALTNFEVRARIVDDAHLLAKADQDGKDLVVFDAEGEQLPIDRLDHTPVFTRGVSRTWFSKPSAIIGTNASGHRILFASFCDVNRQQGVIQYNIDTGAYLKKNLRESTDANDHNEGAVTLAPDGTVIYGAADHSSTFFGVWRSASPYDVSDMGTLINLSAKDDQFTYVNFEWRKNTLDERILMLHYRSGPGEDRPRAYLESTDDGATWGNSVKFFDGPAVGDARPYLHSCTDANGRVYFFSTLGHPREQDDGDNDVVAFYYDTDGKFYSMAGVEVSGVPFDETDCTLVDDASTNGFNFWTLHAACDGDGNPVCLYSETRSATDIRYKYARWNGTAFVVHPIINAGRTVGRAGGQRYYSGGGEIDPADVNTIYVGREDAGGYHQIYKMVTADGGETWSDEQITFNKLKHMHGQYAYFREGAWATNYVSHPRISPEGKGDTDIVFAAPALSATEDSVFWLYYGRKGIEDQQNPGDVADANTVIAVRGDLTHRALSAIAVHGLSGLSVDISAVYRRPESGSANHQGQNLKLNTLASNWNTPNAGVLIRKFDDGSEAVNAFVRVVTTGNLGGTFTDLILTSKQRFGLLIRYGTTLGGLTAFLDGVKSAVAFANENNTSTANSALLWSGRTPHSGEEDGFILFGTVDYLRVSNVARTDDYAKTMSLMLADPADFVTVSEHEALGGGGRLDRARRIDRIART
jgi:hypothetical protein